MNVQIVMPVEVGIQVRRTALDSRFRGHDAVG